MSNAPQEVTITFKGDAAQLINATNQVNQALGKVGAAGQSMSAGTVAAGTAMGVIFADLAQNAMRMARSAITAFENVGKEVYKMQLVIGGSAEEMSKLRYVAQVVGIDSAQLARGLGIASGAISHNSDKWKQLGIAAKDSTGKTRPWTELLPEISDKFRELGGSIDRTAVMKQIFGRGFAAVEPLMDLGSDAIKRFAQEAEDLGLVMSEDDVQAAREFSAQMKIVKGATQGVFVSVGRELIPVLGALVGTIEDAIVWVRQMWQESDTFRGVVTAVASAIAIGTAMFLAYEAAMAVATAATGVFTGAMALLNGVAAANPIGVVIALFLALGAALVWVAKTHEEWMDGFVSWSKAFVNLVGFTVSMAVKGWRYLSDVMYGIVIGLAGIIDGIGWIAEKAAHLLGFEDVDLTFDMRGLLAGFTNMNKALDGFADDAYEWGDKYGEKFGKGLWNALKNLKIPTLKDLLPETTTGGEGIEYPEEAVAAGGKNPIEEQKKRILDFFTNLVRSSRDALNELRRAAIDARKQMQDESRKIAQTLRDSLNISDMVTNTWAKYLGVNALMRGFRRKLDQMKQFVADIKTLKTLGLPVEMLAQIANAGVEGGAAAARLLVQNPQSISELQQIQSEIASVTGEAGRYVATALYGEDVTAKERAAIAAQLQFRDYLGKARQIGYEPTREDLEAAGANIHQEVTINAVTFASPKQLADAVAWALKTGVALGMKPAPTMFTTTATPTKTPAPAPKTTSTTAGGGGSWYSKYS